MRLGSGKAADPSQSYNHEGKWSCSTTYYVVKTRMFSRLGILNAFFI